MKTKDIIYEAINSIKNEYEPAKYLNIEKLTDDSGIITIGVNGIEEGCEGDVLDLLHTSLRFLISGVSSSFGDIIGDFWIVGYDNNNSVSYNAIKRTITYETYTWDEKEKCAYIDDKNYVEFNSKNAAAVISELFTVEELEDKNNFAKVCKELQEIVIDKAETIKDEECKKEFISLSMMQSLEEIYRHLNISFNLFDYENAIEGTN